MMTNSATKEKTININGVEYDIYSKFSGMIGNSDITKKGYFAVYSGERPSNDNSVMKGLLADSMKSVVSFLRDI